MAGRFLVPVIFPLLFAWLAWRDKQGQAGNVSPRHKTRLRVAVIFTLVSMLLFVLQAGPGLSARPTGIFLLPDVLKFTRQSVAQVVA